MSPLNPSDAAAFAQVSQELLSEPVVEQTMQKVVDIAVETIQGCDYAGITIRRHGQVDTPAATDELVNELDQWQYDLSEGPCLDAVFVDDVYVIADMRTEQRWPNWAPKAAGLGIRSILSVRLATPREVVGSLNLYSLSLHAYDEDQVLTAGIYAAHAGAAIAANSHTEGLATALQTRHQIGLAQGMLMQRYQLTEGQAFRLLSRVSQDSNVKLRDVAARVLEQGVSAVAPG